MYDINERRNEILLCWCSTHVEDMIMVNVKEEKESNSNQVHHLSKT